VVYQLKYFQLVSWLHLRGDLSAFSYGAHLVYILCVDASTVFPCMRSFNEALCLFALILYYGTALFTTICPHTETTLNAVEFPAIIIHGSCTRCVLLCRLRCSCVYIHDTLFY
jgi:hypothetical protein